MLFTSVVQAQVLDDLRLSLPLRQFKLNSAFGPRAHPVTGQQDSFHAGIDLHARSDTVFSILPGKVVKVSSDLIIGNYIIIGHGNYISIYGHLSESLVSVGNQVVSGTSIAISGSTGRATGGHLHFGLKHKGNFIDPLKVLFFLSKLHGDELYAFLNDLKG